MLKRNSEKMLLIGVWANRNWILGNWLTEVKIRAPKMFSILWLPFIFAGKRQIEKFFPKVLPTRRSYFFSYLTIFESYLAKNSNKIINRSLIMYPHNEPELGSLDHQVKILNKSFAVYFFCSFDANQLIKAGLEPAKVRISHCAVDVDCVLTNIYPKDPRMVVLASKYGPRKGLELLPDIIKNRPNLNFVCLGRGWENFIASTKIHDLPNFTYLELNKQSRNEFFSKARIFLSLSNLEGGPVPLIEAMAMGVYPIATKTGFALDLITPQSNGQLISTKPSLSEVLVALDAASLAPELVPYRELTWDRMASMMISDHHKIIKLNDGSGS
jgi:glycosyltransferase involved in cell wall biosynthesis